MFFKTWNVTGHFRWNAKWNVTGNLYYILRIAKTTCLRINLTEMHWAISLLFGLAKAKDDH